MEGSRYLIVKKKLFQLLQRNRFFFISKWNLLEQKHEDMKILRNIVMYFCKKYKLLAIGEEIEVSF